MKYSEVGIRAVYKQFCAFPLSDSILSVAKDFPGMNYANCVLCYGYIDREAGLTLEILAAGLREDHSFKFADTAPDIKAMVRIGEVSEEEFYIIDDPDGSLNERYAQKLDMLRNYEVSEEIVESRELTEEDLEDGTLLEDAVRVFRDNRNEETFFEVIQLLRYSYVWIPCSMVLSERDKKKWDDIITSSEDDLDSLIGMTLTNEDEVRMVPDILQSGEDFFFPIFSTPEAMGEYGNSFSQVQKHFLEALVLAKNNERDVRGIVLNAFTEDFVVDRELFDVFDKVKSRIIGSNQDEIKSIKIVSNNLCYGPAPDYNDEIEQHLTISSTGRVWCNRYIFGEGYNYVLKKKEQISIGKDAAVHILGLISELLLTYQRDFVTDVGHWEMEIRYTNGDKRIIDGPLIGNVYAGETDLSDYIRGEVPIDGLFVFDGGAYEEEEM